MDWRHKLSRAFAFALALVTLGAMLFGPIFAVAAFAQDAPPSWIDLGGQAITFVFATVLTPFAVYAFRKMLPSMPRVVVLVLQYGLPQAVIFLGSLTVGAGYHPLVLLLASGVGHILREFLTTIQEHGLK